MYDKTANDDELARSLCILHVLRELGAVVRAGQYAAARALDHEGQEVAEDEDLGQPLGADGRVLGRVECVHEPVEGHVDGGGEDGRGDEEEEILDDVRSDAIVGFLCHGDRPSDESYYLDCCALSVTGMGQGKPEDRQYVLQQPPTMKTKKYQVRPLMACIR